MRAIPPAAKSIYGVPKIYSNEGSMSTWGIFLFLLILFAVFGGNRCGGGLFGGWGGNCGCGVVPGSLASGEGQTDRDVLKLETAMVSANALSTAQLETGIRDLERVATQMFIAGQNEQTRNLITLTTANQEAKSAAEACAINSRLTQIEDKMLTAPTFTPFGGLPLIGCANYGGWNGGCCPTSV